MQVLLDLRFVADILSGGDFIANKESSKVPKPNLSSRRKQDQVQTNSMSREHVNVLINRFSQILDPIDWLT